MARLPDEDLRTVWRAAFEARFLGYPEEECFASSLLGEVRGRDVLSVGSGLGFLEMLFQAHGAAVTCVDIVESNLEVVRRMSSLSGKGAIETGWVADPERPYYGEPDTCDVALVYGSLMTMPPELQRVCIQRVQEALRPGGSLILMLYTWEFVTQTCGWTAPSEFDPAQFARASDPIVGDEPCPWSDWHDDAKILDLVQPGMVITRRQLWNQDRYVWYELCESSEVKEPASFFPADALLEGRALFDLPVDEFTVADATMAVSVDGVGIETGGNNFHYALVSQEFEVEAGQAEPPNLLVIELTLLEGGASVGLLDQVENRFVASDTVVKPGKHRLVLRSDRSSGSFRVVFSNHRAAAGRSVFWVHRVSFLYRALLSL